MKFAEMDKKTSRNMYKTLNTGLTYQENDKKSVCFVKK